MFIVKAVKEYIFLYIMIPFRQLSRIKDMRILKKCKVSKYIRCRLKTLVVDEFFVGIY